MHSLTENFKELLQRLKGGVSSIKQTGFDPVYYLVFPAQEILQAKLYLPEILAKLKLAGFEPRVLSLTKVLNHWFTTHKLRAAWQAGLKDSDNPRADLRQNFSQKLEKDPVIADAILKELESLRPLPNGILILTDIEALHPFLHISGIEQKLNGKFCVPTVVLYPGTRGSSHTLSFLGFNKENANYRSIHIG